MTYGHETENSPRHVQYRMHEDPRMQNRAMQARDGRCQTRLGLTRLSYHLLTERKSGRSR